METVMYKRSHYHQTLNAAKDAQAQQIGRFVHGLTTSLVAKLHPQRDAGAGPATLVGVQPLAAASKSHRPITAHPPPSAAMERLSGCSRASSPSWS
jgi:hypothetical protein